MSRGSLYAAELLTTARNGPWRQLCAATALALPLTCWTAWRSPDDPDAQVWALWAAAALFAMALAFTLDDAALPTLVASPASYPHRRRSRMVVAWILVAPAWGLLLCIVLVVGHASVPALALTAQAVVLCLVAVALAATAQHGWAVAEPGVLVAPVVVGLLLVADQLSGRFPLMVPPGSEWTTTSRNWALVGVLAAAVLLFTGREPRQRRSVIRRGRVSAY